METVQYYPRLLGVRCRLRPPVGDLQRFQQFHTQLSCGPACASPAPTNQSSWAAPAHTFEQEREKQRSAHILRSGSAHVLTHTVSRSNDTLAVCARATRTVTSSTSLEHLSLPPALASHKHTLAHTLALTRTPAHTLWLT